MTSLYEFRYKKLFLFVSDFWRYVAQKVNKILQEERTEKYSDYDDDALLFMLCL